MYVVALHIAHGFLISCDQWPGYGDDWEKQVRLEGDTRDRSVNRLAGLVANKVRDFIYVRPGLVGATLCFSSHDVPRPMMRVSATWSALSYAGESGVMLIKWAPETYSCSAW